jgi:hypothetical protein
MNNVEREQMHTVEKDWVLFIQSTKREANSLYNCLKEDTMFKNMTLHKDPMIPETHLLCFTSTEARCRLLQVAICDRGYNTYFQLQSNLSQECKQRAHIR